MKANGEQLALDQIGLGWLAQPDRDIGFTHREIELFIRREQRDVDIRIEVDKFAQSRGKPMYPDADGRGHPEFPVRALAAVREFGPRRFKLHEYVVRRSIEQFALFGQNETAGMTMKQRNRQFLLKRADLARHRGLRQTELLTGVGKTARLCSCVENFQFVPIHDGSK